MRAIFTNDDVGASATEEAVNAFRTVVQWLNECSIRATFFWVPKPPDWRRCHELWNPVLLEAHRQGHDFQLHGLSHDSCLEFGVPQESTRRTNAAVFAEYEANRARWDKAHSPSRLARKLALARRIYETVFGQAPLVFRAPCFGVCPAMYDALATVGIPHSSSRGINPTATAYVLLGDPELRRWAPDFPCRPWVEPPGVTEHPCMEDLCIGGVNPDQVDDLFDLMTSELGHCLDELGGDGVLIFGSHYHSMARTWEYTRPLLERVLDWLASRGVSEWITFADLVREEA
ncbi:MAG: polysaccharide deacetylase family protein [Armatimonadetes bacterium]|nr:polysaccharide deacetylase family protein [Armatimonadota bacterium]